MKFCRKGHEMNEFNTYVEPSGRRRCRQCGTERVRRYYVKNGGALLTTHAMRRRVDETGRFIISKEEFEARTQPVPECGCWLWDGSCGKHGYGSVSFPGGRRERAHRTSYRLYRGEIPAGMVVCHRCDVPLCVNPDHLFIGTQEDNIRDCAAKGRNRRAA